MVEEAAPGVAMAEIASMTLYDDSVDLEAMIAAIRKRKAIMKSLGRDLEPRPYEPPAYKDEIVLWWCPYHQGNCRVPRWQTEYWPKYALFTHCIAKDGMSGAMMRLPQTKCARHWKSEREYRVGCDDCYKATPRVRLWLRTPVEAP